MGQAGADLASTRRRAAAAAQLLYRAGAQRVWLCGSLAHGNHWDQASDFDFVVSGLAESQRELLVGQLAGMLGGHVDLISLEAAPGWLRAQVAHEMRAVSRDGTVAGSPRRRGPVPAVRLACPGYPQGLHEQRHAVVADVLNANGSQRVLDVGCGDGSFIVTLLRRWPGLVTHVIGVDPAPELVELATTRLDTELDEQGRARAEVRCAGVGELAAASGAGLGEGTGADELHAVVAVEVIEHLDATTLALFAELVWGQLRPRTVVLTTPNAEFNALLPRPAGGGPVLRHPDHRFEWTRDQMRRWLRGTAGTCGYRLALHGIGEAHPDFGSPTQCWTLTRAS